VFGQSYDQATTYKRAGSPPASSRPRFVIARCYASDERNGGIARALSECCHAVTSSSPMGLEADRSLAIAKAGGLAEASRCRGEA